MRQFLTEQFLHEIHEHLDELEGVVAINGHNPIEVARALSDRRYSIPLSGFYWEVQKNGAIAARSNSLEGPMLKVPVDTGANAQVHLHSIKGPTGELLIAERLRWISGENEPMRIIVGTDKRILDQVLDEFNKVLIWSLGLFALSMIAVAGLLLAYSMAPIEQLRTAFARYRSGATPNMRGRFPDEVQPLIDDLNSHLATSREQMQRARAQAGNVAHGLKTPLAILVDEALRLERAGEPRSADVIREQCRRMQSQIDYQIARARAAVSRARPGTASSLSDTAEQVVRALARLHVDRGLMIDNAIPGGCMVACEVQDLNEMLANLLDNACKHARSRVLVRTDNESAPGFVGLVIEDDGAGLPPEAWDVVFKIGEQWSERSDGSGLGLPIVRDLVQLYGGRITLGKSELGGLSVKIELPTFS